MPLSGKTNKSNEAERDIVQQITGNFGRWQLRTILFIFLCKIPTAWFMACIIYTAPTPRPGELICQPAYNETLSEQSVRSNLMDSHWSEDRTTDRKFNIQVCNAYAQALNQRFVQNLSANATTVEPSSTTVSCAHVKHNAAYNSLVTQFDLICSRRVLVALTQSSHAFGALIGGLLAFKALKRISPRRLMLAGMLGQIFCGNLTGLVENYQLHVYFRCLTSVFCTLMYTSGQLILHDITAGKARIIVITLSELFWSIGLVLLPAISIYFDGWSQLYVAISSSLFILVWLHRWIADSPRWLLRRQKIDQVLQLLLESATYNNRMVPLTLDVQLTSHAAELSKEQRFNYCQLWDGEAKRSQLVYIHWIWASALVLYNIILLMIRSLGSAQVHVNTAALGFAEMVGVFVGLYFILYTRRHWRWTGNLMIFAGFCTYLVWLLPESARNSRRVGLELFFWLLLKFANSASLAVLTTCTGEMVSKKKRILLMLSVVSFSRFCLVFSPLLTTLTVVHRLLPITILATLGWLYGLVLRRLNRYYWNMEQPSIGQVPSPHTYRRCSATIMRRRSSTASSEVSAFSSEGLTNFEENIAVSISDLWRTNFQTISERDSGAEMDEYVTKSSSLHTI